MSQVLVGALILFAVVPGTSHAQVGSTKVISGTSGWSFQYRVPHGWTYATCVPAETFITLWPEGQPAGSAKALISVKVLPKDTNDFASFVKGEIADLKEEASQPSKMVIGQQTIIAPTRRLIHIAHSAGDRDELVEYVQGLTDYFAVALTAVTPAATAQYRRAYTAFLDSFVTWPKKCSGHTCRVPPGHRPVVVCSWVRQNSAQLNSR